MLKKLRSTLDSALQMHVAGATVRHSGPFSSLEVLANESPLRQEEIDRYVAPFYRGKKDRKYRESYLVVRDELNEQVISRLLGEFNWRPRSVGAEFCLIRGLTQFEDNIGKLLLRSDVCYSGHNYCLTLADFGSEKAIEYLDKYLEYYLKQPDLWFDQSSALAALFYLEKQNNRNLTDRHMKNWEAFVENKEHWSLQESISRFSDDMRALSAIKQEYG